MPWGIKSYAYWFGELETWASHRQAIPRYFIKATIFCTVILNTKVQK